MKSLRMFFLSVPVLFILTSTVSGQDRESLIKAVEMVVTTRIVRGNPIDSVKRISSASAKQLYCHTVISAPDDLQREIVHIWYLNGEAVSTFKLPVKGGRWRTYSKKVITEGMEGRWRVEARDSEGRLLKAAEFRLN